ncbi:MAG: deoxyribose-phosphate aldolase [Armatimonadaceae bacterium]
MTPTELASRIDQTLLRPDATRRETIAFCEAALPYGFATVCILPSWVADACEVLEGSDTRVCTVAGFPHGNAPSAAKQVEVATAVADGASEVDLVLNISALRSGSDILVFDDIQMAAEICNASGALLKVILECALLSDDEKRRACKLCVEAGAGFVKTSTGFGPGGATIPDIRLLRAAVGTSLGVKASGGIRDTDFALALLDAGADRLGTSSGPNLLGV